MSFLENILHGETEDALSLERAENEKKAEEQKLFWATISHEICTPITSIMGLNELILRENPSEQVKAYAKDIENNSKMLAGLMDDILDFTWLEMNKLKIESKDYITRDLFSEVASTVQYISEEKKIELFFNIDRHMPAALNGDKRRIKQVLTNLLANSVRYTEEGSITISAHTDEPQNGKCNLIVSISDTGIGIKKEDLNKIYEPFSQGRYNSDAVNYDTGFGLAIAKKLVELMGGTLSVDSIYTKGTVFTVTIEQTIVNSNQIGSLELLGRNATDDSYEPSFRAPEARVLIVDDNVMNAMILKRLLNQTKVQIDVAKNGEECLERAKKKFYHVILMDQIMPEMNGLETLRMIRKQENGLCRDSYVILMSEYMKRDDAGQSMEDEFDGYLIKPFRGEQLEDELLKFLPEEIIEHRKHAISKGIAREIQRITNRKHRRILITSDCVCDLPNELLEKYDIKIMYLYIKTENGRFADTVEINSDNLSQYLDGDVKKAYADSVSIEEYENFFAEALTQAEEVIHISLAEKAGKSCEVAFSAAKGFDHVHVIDSGQISCGEGLLVLYAAEMAMEGHKKEEIIASVEKIKMQLESHFMLPRTKIYSESGYFNSLASRFLDKFKIHPALVMKPKKFMISKLYVGDLEHCWRKFIRHHLAKKWRIDKKIIFVTYASITVKQQEMLKKEILRMIPFERVIMRRASFSTACNGGVNSIGIAYFIK